VNRTSCLGHMYIAVKKKLATQRVSRRLTEVMYFQLAHSMLRRSMGLQKCQWRP
jgi:hypothetical protein